MANQEKDKQLDDLLESLLSNYSTMEARPGLETRILANVRDAAAKKRPGLWTLGWAAAGMAAIVAVILFALYFLQPATRIHPAPIAEVKPLVQPPRPIGHSTLAVKARDQREKPRAVVRETPEEIYTLAVQVRPAVFPTPTALSEQEKLLLKYLAGTPRDEVIAQSHSDEIVDGIPDDQSAIPTSFPVRRSITSGTR